MDENEKKQFQRKRGDSMNKELLKKKQDEVIEDDMDVFEIEEDDKSYSLKTLKNDKKSAKSAKYKKETGNRLFQIRKILGLTKDDFAKIFGFHVMKYIRIEDGHNSLSQKDAEWISFCLFNKCKKFIPVKWLLLESNETPKDLYIANKEEMMEYWEDNFSFNSIKDNNTSCAFMEMTLLKKFSPEANIFMVTDSKMPEYKKGDYVSCIAIHQENYDKLNGAACVVTIEEDMRLVRYVYAIDNHLVLTADLGVTPIILSPHHVMNVNLILSKRCNSLEFNELLSSIKSNNIDINNEEMTYEQMTELANKNSKKSTSRRKMPSVNE